MCIAYGPTGSGKSYTCLSLGQQLDPNFSADNVVFDSEQFVKLIQSGKLKKGSVVVFEELGVAANARNWGKDDNIWLSYITQVFRTMNLIVLYTVPRLEFVDMQIAKLTHGHIEALKVDFARKKTIVKVYDPVQYYPKQNKWYKHYVSYRKEGKSYKINRYYVRRVAKEIAKTYELKRDAYLTDLGARAVKFFGQAKTLASERTRLSQERIKEITDTIIRNKEGYMDDKRFYLNKVMSAFDMGGANARRIKGAVADRLKKMGYAILWR